MDEEEARRQIAALKAIVQAMMSEVYAGAGSETGRRLFNLQFEDDEVLAMAIANELGEGELAKAFGLAEAEFGSAQDELTASPVVPHLRKDQRARARVALLAHAEADHAHTLAVRAPERPGGPPLTDEERVGLGEEAFLGRIEIDILHEHEGWSGFTTRARADVDERLEALPDPWRKHAARRLSELKARIRETLERTRVKALRCA